MSMSIYIQALHRRRLDEEIVNKWYKMEPAAHPGTAGDIHLVGKYDKLMGGKFLSPVFDGPPNGLGSYASVISGSMIYTTGGVENSAHLTGGNCSLPPSDFLTNKLYYRDLRKPNYYGWYSGPPMEKHRGGHHAVLVDNKIYVFGAPIRKWEGGMLEDEWSSWAELFDISSFQWNTLPDPYFRFDPTGHAILDNNGSKDILIYCKYSDSLLIYRSLQKKSWDDTSSAGCYDVVTSMGGILYGAGYDRQGAYTVSAIDLDNLRFLRDNKPVKGLEGIHDTVLPSGLIPLDKGKNILCVLTGHRLTNDNLFKICCSTYRMFPERMKSSNELNVTAQLLSSSKFYLRDVISVEACLLAPTVDEGIHTSKSRECEKRMW